MNSGIQCVVCGTDTTVAMHNAGACAVCYATPEYYAAGRKLRVTAAVEATKAMVAPVGYWANTLAQRSGKSPTAAGSIYPDLGVEELEAAILAASWEPYSHPALMAGTSAFRASLPGLMGIVELTKLDPATPVVLDDRKATGTVSATVKGIRGEEVQFTVLILGDNEGKEVVFTLHPGDPVRPSSVKTETGLHGKTITAKEALDMGLTTAKIV